MGPYRFIYRVNLIVALWVSPNGPPFDGTEGCTPALLDKKWHFPSPFPNTSWARSIMACSFETSTTRPLICCLFLYLLLHFSRTRSVASSSSSASLSIIHTLIPSSAKSRAAARPMPEDAPVITAVFSASRTELILFTTYLVLWCLFFCFFLLATGYCEWN
jgi:hypothetical protein